MELTLWCLDFIERAQTVPKARVAVRSWYDCKKARKLSRYKTKCIAPAAYVCNALLLPFVNTVSVTGECFRFHRMHPVLKTEEKLSLFQLKSGWYYLLMAVKILSVIKNKLSRFFCLPFVILYYVQPMWSNIGKLRGRIYRRIALCRNIPIHNIKGRAPWCR